MECRACGTTIADKAIVCFRCGTSTAAPTEATPVAGSAGWAMPWGAVMIALAIMALGVWASLTWIDGVWTRTAGGVVAAVMAAGAFLWLRPRGAGRQRLRVD